MRSARRRRVETFFLAMEFWLSPPSQLHVELTKTLLLAGLSCCTKLFEEFVLLAKGVFFKPWRMNLATSNRIAVFEAKALLSVSRWSLTKAARRSTDGSACA